MSNSENFSLNEALNECLRCGHKWRSNCAHVPDGDSVIIQRKLFPPARCARCRSPLWNTPRKYKPRNKSPEELYRDEKRRPRALDLFCCAGGASMGLYRAGFQVEGVDINLQRNYPFRFHQANALDFDVSSYDFVWASPPCQRYSTATPPEHREAHPDLIQPIREKLRASGVPYIIENVEGARYLLENPIMLCGSMFGLDIIRHRYFEVYPAITPTLPACKHPRKPTIITGQSRRTENGVRARVNTIKEKQEAIDIFWMAEDQITQSIPPCYSEFLGTHIMKWLLNVKREVA